MHTHACSCGRPPVLPSYYYYLFFDESRDEKSSGRIRRADKRKTKDQHDNECSELRREARTVQQRANQVTPPDHFVKMPKRPSDTTVQVASAPASSMTSSRLKIRIKRFHAVSRWSWNVNDEVCGICQTAFEGTSPNVKYPGEDCPVVFGKCGHAFHLQCVSQWLSTSQANNKQQSCPICRAEWVFGENPVSRESV
jgi:anaphase-promoting complex subunit 11